MKNLLKCALIVFSFSIHAHNFFDEMPERFIEACENENAWVAIRYLGFLQGSSFYDKAAITKKAESLCAPDCKKILNGKVVFEHREAYAEQLAQAKEALGSYAIEPLEILSSFREPVIFIRHLVYTEKAGCQIVFVILRYNSDLLITEINEVYNKNEGLNSSTF